MAQRSSRSKKNQSRKQPELRTGGGRQAKAARSQARQAAVTRTSTAGPLVRMRPTGVGGVLFQLALALLGVAAVAWVGKLFGQWELDGFPDSLWLYAAIGAFAVAPALGHIARTRGDVVGWTMISLVMPAGLLVAETLVGPECPDGGSCAALGARGAMGTTWSIIVIVVCAASSWGLATMFYARARNNRPASGRVRAGRTAITVVLLTVSLGGPLAAIGLALDVNVRDSAGIIETAVDQVQQNCFDLAASPSLIARPAPQAIYDGWTTVAVRRASESRPGIGKSKLPKNWDDLNTVHPYEALVAFAADGQVAALNCQRVSPASGNATTDDIKPNAPESNPMDPQTTGSQFYPLFYTQGPKEPTAAEKKAEAAKAAKAKKDAAAKKKTASAKTKTPAKK